MNNFETRIKELEKRIEELELRNKFYLDQIVDVHLRYRQLYNEHVKLFDHMRFGKLKNQ